MLLLQQVYASSALSKDAIELTSRFSDFDDFYRFFLLKNTQGGFTMLKVVEQSCMLTSYRLQREFF